MNQVQTIMPNPAVIGDNNNAGVKGSPPNQVAIANEAEASPSAGAATTAAVAATATNNSTNTKMTDSGSKSKSNSASGSNFLALLTAASRVDTLPVEPEAFEAEDNDDQPGHLQFQLQARAVSESSTNSSPGLTCSAGPKRGPSFLTKGKRPKKPRRLPTSINTARPRLAGTADAEAEAAAEAALAGTSDGMLYTVAGRSFQPPATEPEEKDTFPLVLYRVLMASSEAKEAEAANGSGESSGEQNPTKNKKKYDEIITWLDSGTHFVILDPDRFMSEVMVSLHSIYKYIYIYLSALSDQILRCMHLYTRIP